jgi:two-component system phosphate regulon response regulator PhoB
MAKEKILVIEDDADIVELVEYNLARDGYQVISAGSGEEGLDRVRSNRPNLIVLDLMLPGIDGLEVCKLLKRDPKTAHIPVVMLTAKGEESDIVSGLELGADDYVTKPFSPKVLVARIRALLRRKAKEPTDKNTVVTVHDLVIHPGRREVLLNGDPIELTFTEFGILHALARRPGWVFTRYQLVDSVRGEAYAVTERSIDVHIAALRKKLGSASGYIETVRGVGYRFKE